MTNAFRFHRPLAATLFVLATLARPASAGDHMLPVGPSAGDQDLSPIYRWQGSVLTGPGRLLKREPLPADLVPRQASTAERVLYSSIDWRWNSGAVPVSGVIYMPRGKAPRGGWPLVVWAHGTLGVADSCAPSWTGSNPRDRSYIARWLDEGFAVAAPDYQGLGGPGPHPYLQWQAEGRSVLDAARAALHAGLPIANAVVITGQSQGSGAALGAARLAASYAPDLKVKGAIATALVTTFADPKNPAVQAPLGGSPYYLIYRLMTGSLKDGAPPVESFLTNKGKILLDAARTRCDARAVAQANGITMENAFAVPLPQIDAALGLGGAMDPFRTRFPLMLGTGLADELIPAGRQIDTENRLCKAGNSIVLHRYLDTHHGDTLPRSANDAVAFARTVLSGRPVASDCK